MLFALDYNGNRIKAEKGATGFCPICNEKVDSFCGPVYIHHWKHKIDRDCDPWKEHETDWHREWKEEFIEDWREVVITRGSEKHRADIKTSNGLVVEFQNSSISADTIQLREDFYGRMIWVINSQSFKDNFIIRSAVNSQLKNNNLFYGEDYYNVNEEEPPDLKKGLSEAEDKLKTMQLNFRWKELELQRHLKFSENIADLAEDYLYRHFRSLDGFSLSMEALSRKNFLTRDIEELEKKLTERENALKHILELDNCNITNYNNYRFVPITGVKPSSFKVCRIIEKSTLNTIFPNVITIKDEAEFNYYKLYPLKYSLIADITPISQRINNEIAECKKSLQESENALKDLKTEVMDTIDIWLTFKIEDLENELEVMGSDLEKHQNEVSNKNAEYIKKRNEYFSELARLKNEAIKDKANRDINIKRQYKGLYFYIWKHQRKSWNFSSKILYLDFGSHLFEILPKNTLRKISKELFIEKVKNWE